ncbi:MAG: ATP synthase F1 subunit gamma [Eubacteriales bacterium]
MASAKGIKHRIANIANSKKIMEAMDMISAAKLQKARARLSGIRPLYRETRQVIDTLTRHEGLAEHPLVCRRPVRRTAYVIITADRGLCGSYNQEVASAALSHMEDGRDERIIVLGSWGYDYFRSRRKHILRHVNGIAETLVYQLSERISELVLTLYQKGEFDEVYLAYTDFESTLTHRPRVEKLLPLTADSPQAGAAWMGYQPDPGVFLEHLCPLYLHTGLFRAWSESLACEHAARMMNVQAAAKNAADMVEDLQRLYHRKRKAAITQELNEIIGGANMLS